MVLITRSERVEGTKRESTIVSAWVFDWRPLFQNAATSAEGCSIREDMKLSSRGSTCCAPAETCREPCRMSLRHYAHPHLLRFSADRERETNCLLSCEHVTEVSHVGRFSLGHVIYPIKTATISPYFGSPELLRRKCATSVHRAVDLQNRAQKTQ
jgi:hypothetical protein